MPCGNLFGSGANLPFGNLVIQQSSILMYSYPSSLYPPSTKAWAIDKYNSSLCKRTLKLKYLGTES